jgi:palmitoyltransferase ZDHHC9/14/18
MRSRPISFILLVIAFPAVWFVCGLTGYHIYLVCVGQTTNEQLKTTFPWGSPHTQGWRRNCAQLFCTMPKPPYVTCAASSLNRFLPLPINVSVR